MKRHLDAVWCYRDALVYDNTATRVWTNLGNALTRLNNLSSAIFCHRRAIALSQGEDALIHRNLGISLAEAGQHGEAVISFSRALKIDPSCHMARWAVNAFERAFGDRVVPMSVGMSFEF